jgi:Uma2 family endonuclease
VTPAPSIIHQVVLGNLHRILANYIVSKPLGKLLIAPTDVLLTGTTVVQPDLIFLAKDRLHLVTGQALEGSPTLVVEILSPSTHQTDRVTKAQLYARYGVPQYWLIDPEERTLEAYELTTDHYVLSVRAQNDEGFAPALFPGLSIQLADLWA